jgi:hypothetical protein
MNAPVTASIDLWESFTVIDTGHTFKAVQNDADGSVRIVVHDLHGFLQDSLDPADLDQTHSIEEVAHAWLDEHRPGWDR